MQIVEIKVSRRKTPPGACVEFIGANSETIEVELRGEEFAEMSDDEIIGRAKATMTGASGLQADDISEDAGLDQTLGQP